MGAVPGVESQFAPGRRQLEAHDLNMTKHFDRLHEDLVSNVRANIQACISLSVLAKRDPTYCLGPSEPRAQTKADAALTLPPLQAP